MTRALYELADVIIPVTAYFAAVVFCIGIVMVAVGVLADPMEVLQ